MNNEHNLYLKLLEAYNNFNSKPNPLSQNDTVGHEIYSTKFRYHDNGTCCRILSFWNENDKILFRCDTELPDTKTIEVSDKNIETCISLMKSFAFEYNSKAKEEYYS